MPGRSESRLESVPASRGISDAEARAKGMEEKSAEFLKQGGSVYVKAKE